MAVPRNLLWQNQGFLLDRIHLDESVRFHDLRHTFATLALTNGVDAKTVSSMPGHSSSSFTLDLYTHVTTQMQQAAADKMANFMESAMPSAPPPEPPDPPQESGCKVIPFERVG